MAGQLAKTSAVGRAFEFRTLDRPTITHALRQRVLGAYDYISSIYSFRTPDIHLGAKLTEVAGLTRTDYCEYEKTFNSVLLGSLLNALVNGSMLLFGPPGSGKTTVPEVIGQVLLGRTLKEIEEATVYCHPNLTEEKTIGSFDIPKLVNPAGSEKEVVWSRWVLDFYRMLDEVNRKPPEISALFMQAVDRRRVSYAGEVRDMPFGPIFATANYYDAGNFEMTRPYLDRFALSVHTEGLSPQDLDMLFVRRPDLDRKRFAIGQEEREQVYAEIQSIAIDQNTLALLVHLASGLSSCQLAGNHWYEKHKGRFGEQKVECDSDKCGFKPEQVVCSQINEQGLTTRSLEALRDFSRAFAWLMGEEAVHEDIVKVVFALVMAHRLSPSRKALNGGESAEGVNIEKALFMRRTFDFADHLFELGRTSFEAQRPIYAEIESFYEAVAQGGKTPDILLKESEELLGKVDAMEDPAKWEILKSLHAIRQILRTHASSAR
jgi:MoxR-like ATPase